MSIHQTTIEAWIDSKASLDAAKEQEMELRTRIADSLLAGKEEGTHNFEMYGYKLKLGNKFNYKLDPNVDMTILSDLEKSVIVHKPSLLLKDYKMLVDSPNLDEFITVNQATPTLKIDLDGS